MNTDAASAVALARGVAQAASTAVDVGVAPPSLFVADVVRAVGDLPVAVYAQDVSAHDSGAFTGEISASMLASVGARGALVGHSERRAMHGEGDDVVNAKLRALRGAGLEAILCIGETLEERDAGTTMDVVLRQLAGGLDGIETSEGVTIAYEPVWAIGTGRTATPEQAQEVHAGIRGWIAERFGADGATLRVLYGGSMKPGNASGLMACADIDGGLVGGASLDATSFASIIEAATP